MDSISSFRHHSTLLVCIDNAHTCQATGNIRLLVCSSVRHNSYIGCHRKTISYIIDGYTFCIFAFAFFHRTVHHRLHRRRTKSIKMQLVFCTLFLLSSTDASAFFVFFFFGNCNNHAPFIIIIATATATATFIVIATNTIVGFVDAFSR